MRLTITCDPRRRGLRVHVEWALDYPPGHVPGLLAAATADALTQPPPTADEVALPGLARAPRTPRDDQEPAVGDAHREADDPRVRHRVLRALNDGATVAEAARRFGIDPAQIDRWDDDPAIDAHTDLLGAGPGGHHPARVAS